METLITSLFGKQSSTSCKSTEPGCMVAIYRIITFSVTSGLLDGDLVLAICEKGDKICIYPMSKAYYAMPKVYESKNSEYCSLMQEYVEQFSLGNEVCVELSPWNTLSSLKEFMKSEPLHNLTAIYYEHGEVVIYRDDLNRRRMRDES